MKKGLNLIVAVIFLSLIVVQAAQAQLIDYNRRSRYNDQEKRTTTPVASSRTPVTKPTSSAAAVYEVQNRFEKKYDLNRDGQLKGEELTKLFSDVIKEVEDDGRSVVMSDILESYDANGDGYISRYEVTRIVQDMKQ